MEGLKVMRVLRYSGSLLALFALISVAACGGGGGGSVPSPGGGNGGGNPTSSPSTNPTSSPTTAPSAPAIPTSSTTLQAYDGPVNGTDNWQTNGVTVSSDAGDGDTSSGATGSNTVDGISCSVNAESDVTSSNYHVHVFIGIYVNGTEMAIPDAIGMENPADNNTPPILTFTCAYPIHTHWASGIIHVEDPGIVGTWQGNTGAPPGTPQIAPPPKYNLQSVLDIWGQTISSIGGGASLTGIYVGTPSAKDPNGNDVVTSYSPTSSSPTNVLLAHHNAIWLIYGTPPSGLPKVDIGLEN